MKSNNNLRPNCFDEYIGQKNIIENLKIFIESAIKRKDSLDHILLNGNSGLGKTSLAILIAKTMSKKIYTLNGTSLQKPSDIISPLTSLKEGEFLFIDEVHACSKEVFEVLYPVLEDGRINVIIGKEYNSKIINIKLANFTLIAATTEINKLSIPFINRFPINFNFKDYNDEEIAKIIEINIKKININLNYKTINIISKYCKSNPRVAINLLKRLQDYIICDNVNIVDENTILKILNKLEIYKYGISSLEINYLKLLQNYKILGLEHIAQLLSLSQSIIVSNIEPILYKNSLIIKTPKGRKITSKGEIYLRKINSI
ncbi:Holliday junction branch migration DNA helicase RuvB [Spiroplasma turonicum]|uniref:Holliday junction branch migration complex subunit RuvB n=1 Tax=Spiroplasma turonicum TaxID=216946 RepID=A0A0K1P622_9MOLU|nr:Holliday junction branch migration DNA helicase RuvB [Spiroplasma turonicum]AKU79751.1 Holliday junction DNA helicase RuvB [Spiroplasma turonicum]ALX70769.1 Holliday junction DNA helicase RuvB [Spiroplasma turonicum]